MTTLTFTVHGLPAPQGSKRHVGNGVMVESSRHVKTWREDVKQAALRALADSPDWDPDAPCVLASIVFVLPRPRSHFRTGSHAHELRADAPLLHTKTPDLDKLLRSTGDALTTAGAYRDDSRLAQVFVTKSYPSHPDQQVPGALPHPGATVTLMDGRALQTREATHD